MKKKTKIILVATLVLSLTITAYHWQPQMSPKQPDVRPVSALTQTSRDNTPPPQGKAVVSDENPEIGTQSEKTPKPIITESKVTETVPPQPTAPTSTEPKMGNTSIVNGKKQSYFLGFG